MTITTAEVERASLRNQLLFHELLAAFSHLDGLNIHLRVPGNNIVINDCHLRFERSTEMSDKSVEDMENLLRRDFVDFRETTYPCRLLLCETPPYWVESQS